MNAASFITSFKDELFATADADRAWFDTNGHDRIRLRPSTSCELVLAPDVPMSFVVIVPKFILSLVPPNDYGLIHNQHASADIFALATHVVGQSGVKYWGNPERGHTDVNHLKIAKEIMECP